MEGEEPPKTSKDILSQSIGTRKQIEKILWDNYREGYSINAEKMTDEILAIFAAPPDPTEHCFICHKEIELGSTASSIHTGCMALLTPNAEVEKEIAAAREEGKEEGMRVGTTATLKLEPEEMSAWTTKDAQAYREGYETALKEAIEAIEKTLESSSGGGNWRRNFIQLLSSLQSKLK